MVTISILHSHHHHCSDSGLNVWDIFIRDALQTCLISCKMHYRTDFSAVCIQHVCSHCNICCCRDLFSHSNIHTAIRLPHTITQELMYHVLYELLYVAVWESPCSGGVPWLFVIVESACFWDDTLRRRDSTLHQWDATLLCLLLWLFDFSGLARTAWKCR